MDPMGFSKELQGLPPWRPGAARSRRPASETTGQTLGPFKAQTPNVGA